MSTRLNNPRTDLLPVEQVDLDLAEWFLRRMPGWQSSRDQVARLLAAHRITHVTPETQIGRDGLVGRGKFTDEEAKLLGQVCGLQTDLERHDSALAKATGFEGIEQAADAQDAIMEKLPGFLRAVSEMLNKNVDARDGLSLDHPNVLDEVGVPRSGKWSLADVGITPQGTPQANLDRAAAYHPNVLDEVEKPSSVERLAASVAAFLVKWAVVEPHMNSAFLFQQNHGVTYTGPTMGEEMDAMRAALAAIPADPLRARLGEALTPSPATKAAYIGEFSFCIDEQGDSMCEVTRTVDVPWTTIKEIMAAIRARALLAELTPESEHLAAAQGEA